LSFQSSSGSEIWKEFERFLSSETDEGQLIVYYTKLLFSQAARAYDAGVYLGTAVLCRSSLETAFFLFLYGRWDRGLFSIDIPRNSKGKKVVVQSEQLKKEIMGKVAFPKTVLSAIDSVQDDGNLTAHFASIRIEAAQRWEQDVIRETNRLFQSTPTPEKWTQMLEKLERSLGIIASPNSALEDLRNTSSILMTILNEFMRQQRVSMSGVTV
jgi:hypothetical protein